MGEEREAPQEKQTDSLGFERIVFFSDAVMAIAITLMALEIRLPELEPDQAAAQISAVLLGIVPHVAVYVLSFLVIGIYWVLHHRLFRLIKRYDITVIWLNLIFLMFVAFVPAATNMLETYPSLPLVTNVYAVSLASMGLSQCALWLYALRKNFVEFQHQAPRLGLYVMLRILTPPAVFLLSLPVAWIDPYIIEMFWALMIPVFFVLRFVFPREHAARQVFESGSEG